MRKVLIILLLFCNCIVTFASDSLKIEKSFWESFEKGGYASLLFNQISFSNWAKGGENSISSTGLFNYHANIKTGRLLWENLADLKYGLQVSDEYGFRTNQDVIDLSTKLGYQALTYFYYSGLINFKSQFTTGYNYPNDSVIVSNVLAPAYLIVSLGVDFKPLNNLSLYLSPMTGKFIMIIDDRIANDGRYTGEPAIYNDIGLIIKEGTQIKSDFGAFLRILYNLQIMENTTLNTKLEVFNNYTDKNIKNRRNFDIESETTINMKVNEFISANLFLHLIYDNDTKIPIYEYTKGVKTQVGSGPRLQLKEVIGIGLSYQFK